MGSSDRGFKKGSTGEIEASSSGKRETEDDDGGTCSAASVLVRSYATVLNIPGTCSANENSLFSKSDLKIVVPGVKRKMRHSHSEGILPEPYRRQ